MRFGYIVSPILLKHLSMRIYLLILLVASSVSTYAQDRRWPPRPHPRPTMHRPHERRIRVRIGAPNVLTVGAGLGGLGGEICGTVRLEYERFINREGTFSVTLPLTRYGGGTFGEWHEGQTVIKLSGFFASPGFYYHPFGNKVPADFSIGLCIPLGFGETAITHVDGTINPTVKYHDSFNGILARMNIVFYPGPNGAMGLFAEVGPLFNSINHKSLFGQVGIRIGGRF